MLNAKKLNILVTFDLPEGQLKKVRENYDVILPPSDFPISREDLLKLVPGVEAILCTSFEKIDEELLEKCGKSLKVVSTMSAGYNHIDVSAAKKRNILLGNTPGVLADSVAEVNVGLILCLLRGFLTASKSVTSGSWANQKPTSLFAGLGESLSGKVIGFLGMGGIGVATAKRLKPFRISKIIYCNRNISPHAQEVDAELVSLERLAEESDIIVVCASLSESTYHIINKEFISKMKPSAYLVNTSRGDLVNQIDLIEALQSKTIRGAGLDVMTPEPLPADSALIQCPNLVLLPHMGSATESARNGMAVLAVENLLQALQGKDMPAEIL